MARKKATTNVNLIAEQSEALVDYATTALATADQLRVEAKPIEHFPLEEQVRAAVAELAAVPAGLKRKLVKRDAVFTVEESAIILMAVGESLVDAEPKKQAALLTVARSLLKCLKANFLMLDVATQDKKPTETVFQFKITIKDIEPAIWRRIQVPDCTLTDFHEYIQAAFGWENYHLHQFEINDVRYSLPVPDGDSFDMDFEDETQVMLSELLPKSAKRTRWKYEYDFGDSWWHEVLFEKFPAPDAKVKPPICLEGERVCPPEDCGGPWGYDDFLAALADPKHKRHEELLEWRVPFDSEAFDAETATKEMRKVE